MKIRITTNSIRIRIRKSELKQLMTVGNIKDRIEFSPSLRLIYGLSISKNVEDLTAAFEESQITISIPETMAQKWADTEVVGLETHAPNGSASKLHLLVEKDFPCLDREEEDRDDTFWELSENKEPRC